MNRLTQFLKHLHPEVDFDTENALIDGGILDSFDVISIVAEIDDLLGVEVPPEELTAENFNSAQALCSMVRRLSGD